MTGSVNLGKKVKFPSLPDVAILFNHGALPKNDMQNSAACLPVQVIPSLALPVWQVGLNMCLAMDSDDKITKRIAINNPTDG